MIRLYLVSCRPLYLDLFPEDHLGGTSMQIWRPIPHRGASILAPFLQLFQHLSLPRQTECSQLLEFGEVLAGWSFGEAMLQEAMLV